MVVLPVCLDFFKPEKYEVGVNKPSYITNA